MRLRLSSDVCSGSFSDLDARSREVCFAPMNGHRQTDPSRPKSARSGSEVVWTGRPRLSSPVHPGKPQTMDNSVADPSVPER